jgi:hypothetical protein
MPVCLVDIVYVVAKAYDSHNNLNHNLPTSVLISTYVYFHLTKRLIFIPYQNYIMSTSHNPLEHPFRLLMM